ncbi:glycine cleavage system aminomethyltransferase GcvT [Arthrobacter sp. GN70]|uniref:Glycine cleavage system T protein n=1 Tax=Arthrobacter terricola TaxID=2547396 RepID=A0A4R5K815_9MICC|nr:glycine cleavage system aminomethyltransferase GcvT [Arthrobacter sp. GN70]TDF87867.1 glycine cleavage system aminomethyltransferase GcvT [Arthrobacter terricola]
MTLQSKPNAFVDRHIGARRQADVGTMLKAVGYDSVDGLVDTAVPASIRQEDALRLTAALCEVEVLAELRKLAAKNKTAVQMIGQGYYDTVMPPVIRRNILEAPAWYTAYTPYQPEISQGRLEAPLNFQTMVQDLTALRVANASLLDEATAVAEAVLLMRRANKKNEGKTVLDADCLPQTIAIVKGRAEALGFEVEVADLSQGLPDGDINGVVLQQPGVSGRVFDHSGVIAAAKERGALVTVAADLLALTLITPPGEQGADIAVGTAQRFGVPLFFGGPHAAYMAVQKGLERSLPGRLVGVSKDNAGVPTYRLALQTREQHIRREEATSKYESELAEHHAVRKSAGIFDLSHMGEVWVTGPDAAAFLDYALAGKISAVAVGKAKYSLICQEDGGIIDDLISYRRTEDKYLVVPNAGNAKVVAAALRERAAGFDVTVEDVSAETSLIAIQGPNAEAILLTLVPADHHSLVTELKYYAAVEVEINGPELLLARTGYTGEDGFEIYVPNEDAPGQWEALFEAGEGHGLIPAGLAARDSLRLEAGMPLYGNELSRDGNPYTAGLGPVVSLAKESDFVGKSALRGIKEAGAGSSTGRKLVGLKGLGRRAGRSHYPVLKDGNVVGEVTSGQPSRTLSYPVAMAYVDVAYAEPGTALDIDLRGTAEPFEIVALPFYKREK